MKKKTLIIIIVSIILALLVVGALVYFFVFSNKEKVSKISKMYDSLSQVDKYTFVRKVDDENQVTNIKNGEKAYKEEISQGSKGSLTYYDGNTYFMNDAIKIYYEYQNNDYIYTEIVNNFLRAKDSEYVTGKEEINGKKYYYEEISGYQDFLVNQFILLTAVVEWRSISVESGGIHVQFLPHERSVGKPASPHGTDRL